MFDEAHQLVETGVQFLGVQLGTSQLIDFARDLLAVGSRRHAACAPGPTLAAACEHAARDLRLACAGALRDVRGMIKLAWEERRRRRTFNPR